MPDKNNSQIGNSSKRNRNIFGGNVISHKYTLIIIFL